MTVVVERGNDEDEETQGVQAVPQMVQVMDVDVQAEDCGCVSHPSYASAHAQSVD